MKVTLDKLKEILKDNEPALKKLDVKSLSAFGSVVRGEATEESDVDLLIEFDRPVGMFQFLEVKYLLEKMLDTTVDLATVKALHPLLKDDILKEAVRVA